MECVVQDLPIYYEVEGEGFPVIMLHGFYPDHRLMKGCMEPIFAQKSGWSRIYFDLPGMGKTPGKDWIKGSDDMLAIVTEFIQTILPDQPFVLVGESYGGYLARGILSQMFDRVAGLGFICPLIIPDMSQRTLPPRTVLVEDQALLTSLDPFDREGFGSFAVVQDEYNWQRFRDEVRVGLQMADTAFLTKLQQNYGFSFEVDLATAPFTKPTLFIMGRQDDVTGYRDAWPIIELYPRATFAILDRAGHNLQIEQSLLFNELVGERLNRVRESIEPSHK